MGIGDFLFDLFAGLGDQGILICIFLLFLLDALLVPTLPELFFILAIGANTSWEFGLTVLAVGFLGEMVGVFFLYNVVKRTGLPKRVDKALKKYINFLIVSDEKVMLINRVAPMVPFTGAVMAAMRKRWDVRKCIFWLATGYVFKYGLIMLFGQTATAFFDGGTSRTIMLVAIIAMIVISAAVAFLRKKKMGIDGQEVEE
ncbi:hypothetical protein PED39_03095 [Methanomassiliicoccales archaeon LGM-RCC1]|nr:hypothetical protein PED39_03095 [Methanomassiliicoccales archaeon LGM-RCC1]